MIYNNNQSNVSVNAVHNNQDMEENKNISPVMQAKAQYLEYNKQSMSYTIDQRSNVGMGNPEGAYIQQIPIPSQNAGVPYVESFNIQAADPNMPNVVINQENLEPEKREFNGGWMDCIPAIGGHNETQEFHVKVFALLTAKTTIIMMICALVYGIPDIESWFEDYWWFFFIMLGVSSIITCAVLCLSKIFKIFPLNYLILLTYSIVHGFMFASLSGFLSGEGVFLASTISPVLFATLTIAPLFFKQKLHCLIMTGIFAITICLLAMFYFIFFTERWYYIIPALFLIFLTGIFVYADIDLIVARYGISYGDYAIGASILYGDMIVFFIIAMGSARNSRGRNSRSLNRNYRHGYGARRHGFGFGRRR